MTYFVNVTITKGFESKIDAEAFAEKVLESTKGEASYSEEITYVKPLPKVNPNTYTFNTTVHNPVVDDSATSVQKRINRVAQMGRFEGDR